MTTFTPQQKKDLEPLARRVTEWNNGLDDVADSCSCTTNAIGQIVADQRCPGAPSHCLSRTLIAIRVSMNLLRLANDKLSDAQLVPACRALRDVFAGLPNASSHTAFANELLLALRQREAFATDEATP